MLLKITYAFYIEFFYTTTCMYVYIPLFVSIVLTITVPMLKKFDSCRIFPFRWIAYKYAKKPFVCYYRSKHQIINQKSIFCQNYAILVAMFCSVYVTVLIQFDLPRFNGRTIKNIYLVKAFGLPVSAQRLSIQRASARAECSNLSWQISYTVWESSQN